MIEADLNRIFDIILSGGKVEGWGGNRDSDSDSLAEIGGRVWERPNNPIGPWVEVPPLAGGL